MATQLQPPAALASAHGREELTECPTCGQPLLDHEAIERVEHAQRDREKQIDKAAGLKAESLAKEKIEALTKAVEARDDKLVKLKSGHRDTLAHQQRQHEEQIATVRDQAAAEAQKAVEEKYERKVRQQAKVIDSLTEQTEIQHRKIEHLTSDERGEMNEEDLLASLRREFPEDRIERRGRGRAGSDILQEIRYPVGDQTAVAGLIVYECKDTLQWANEFLGQAKKARVTHRTSHVVIVSRAFPRNEKNLCVRDEVPIVAPAHLVAFGRVLRAAVIELHRATLTSEGQLAKTQELYEYLSGGEFRQEFDAVLEGPRELTELLGKEREAHERMWAKRNQIHGRISGGASAIDGRLRAIIETRDGTQAKVLPLERGIAS